MSYSWGAEKYSGGCYEAVPRVNCADILAKEGPAVHAERVAFACTEISKKWIGFVEGALESGERAADEIIAKLRPDEAASPEQVGQS